MAITQYNTINVASCFNVALEYYDISGLSDDDITALDNYIFNHVRPNTCYEFSLDTDFCQCAITGLMTDCLEVKLFN